MQPLPDCRHGYFTSCTSPPRAAYGRQLDIDGGHELIHRALTVHGSWVTSVWRMEEPAEKLVAWGLHPEVTVTDRFALAEAEAACRTADAGGSGKVAIVL